MSFSINQLIQFTDHSECFFHDLDWFINRSTGGKIIAVSQCEGCILPRPWTSKDAAYLSFEGRTM